MRAAKTVYLEENENLTAAAGDIDWVARGAVTRVKD